MVSNADGNKPLLEIKGIILRRLALMICGDAPYNENFPYRTGGLLTAFFGDLLLDYVHDGSTRRGWVEWVLKDLPKLETKSDTAEERFVLTAKLCKVIAYIVEPLHFASLPGKHPMAVEQLNELLQANDLRLVYNETGKSAQVVSLEDDSVLGQTSKVQVPARGILVVRPTVFQVPERRDLPGLQCGVLMPFGGLFDEIYRDEIKLAITAAGYSALRADELWKSEILINDIFDLLFHSTVVVADLSGRNPNVFYELGIAHTLGRTVVPIVQNRQDVPFDLRHHRYLEYQPTMDGRKQLRQQLEARLRQLLGHRSGQG